MAEPEFRATGVRIGKRLRSLTRAGTVRISGGRVELLTSYGSEIDSAPVQAVRASRPWFAPHDRALADLNGKRYLLTLGERDPAPGEPGRPRPGVSSRRCAGPRGDALEMSVSCGASPLASRWSHVTLGLPAITLRTSPPATTAGGGAPRAPCWIRTPCSSGPLVGESQP